MSNDPMEKKLDELCSMAVQGPVKTALREAIKYGFGLGVKQGEQQEKERHAQTSES